MSGNIGQRRTLSFRRVHKVAKSAYQLRHVRPSIHKCQLICHWAGCREIWYCRFLYSLFFVSAFYVQIIRKANINFVMSVRPAARDNSVPTERIFMKFRFWNFYENLSRKFKFCRHLIKITVTLHEDLRTFMTTVATTLSWLAMFLRSLLLFLLQWLP